MILIFILPVVVICLVFYLWPIARTLMMSFFKISSITSPMKEWQFNGFNNYMQINLSPLFQRSMKNIILIWLVGGVFNFIFSFLFAVYITKLSGKEKRGKFYKTLIYLPNIITPVAIVTIWTQYIFNNRFGLLKNIFDFIGLHQLAAIPWTSQMYSFWAMTIAYTFGSVGYYMIMLSSAMKRIPQELYESAMIEGAGPMRQFGQITLPLIKDVHKMAQIFWALSCVNFFLWSRVFSINDSDPATLSPVNLLYTQVFGNSIGASTIQQANVGAGAAVAVYLTLIAIVVFGMFQLAFGKENYEY
ncbi:MAG: sugar transporter permease [Oscillospiraceae bacterium]|nr:sugar transporter permease [Oscillospiraceae bacterium]